jgi:predicted enzyme related to lactoylglutathione lyase
MDTITSPKIKRMSPLFLVADLERAIEFYTNKLGFSVDFRYEDFYAGIIKDGYSIHLKSGETSVDKRKNNEDPDIIFSVDGVKDLYEEILSKSVEIIQPLRDMPYGKEFYIIDTDGNVIAFIEA